MITLSLSVSLVVYKPDLAVLGRVLDALQQAAHHVRERYEIRLDLALVDNSCDEPLRARLKSWAEEHAPDWPDWAVQVIQSPGNIGYGRANNLAIEQAQSDYHLVINPDLFVAPDALSVAIAFMQANPDVGLLTPAVSGEDGARHYLCKRKPTLFIMFLRGFGPRWLQALFQSRLDAFEMRDCDYDSNIERIEFPTGCFMFFRTSFLQQLRGFDPAFFMYMEDADIGWRMQKIARVVYVPAVKVVHQWARASHHNWRMRWELVRSVFVYWSKWGGIA